MISVFKRQACVFGICSVVFMGIVSVGLFNVAYVHSAATTPQQEAVKDTDDNKTELGRKILEKIVEAQGGHELISKIRDSTVRADYKILPQGTDIMAVSYVKLPDKLRIDMKGVSTRAFDGKSGWMNHAASVSVQDLSERALEEFKNSSWAAQGMLNPEILNISPALEGRVPVDGKEYILISYTNWGGFDTVYVHVDPDTFLPYISTNIKSNRKTQVIYSDYREIDGLKLPFSINMNIDGTIAITMSVREWKINSNLDDSLFTRESFEAQMDPTRFLDSSHEPELIHKVEPIYPTLAKRARVSGEVILRITIDEEGLVGDVRVFEGHPMLTGAARSAVQQWRYRPTIQNGKPIPVTKRVTINF